MSLGFGFFTEDVPANGFWPKTFIFDDFEEQMSKDGRFNDGFGEKRSKDGRFCRKTVEKGQKMVDLTTILKKKCQERQEDAFL